MVLQPIWLSEIIGGMLLMCQSTTMRVYGPWIKTYFVLCSKTCSSYGYVLWSSASLQQAGRVTRICETGLLEQHYRWLLQDYPIDQTYLTWNSIMNEKKEKSNKVVIEY